MNSKQIHSLSVFIGALSVAKYSLRLSLRPRRLCGSIFPGIGEDLWEILALGRVKLLLWVVSGVQSVDRLWPFF
jgi:hypothetical protein